MTLYPEPQPDCECGHLWGVHDIGTRDGERVRTGCLHGDATGPCSCARYRPAGGDR